MASCDAVRFMPGFGPGTPLRFSGLGGANWSLAVAPADALGVLASPVGCALESTADVEGDDADAASVVVTESDGYFESESLGSRRTISLLLGVFGGAMFD